MDFQRYLYDTQGIYSGTQPTLNGILKVIATMTLKGFPRVLI